MIHRRLRPSSLIAIGLVLAVVSMSACQHSRSNSVLIGMLAPLTGAGARFGQSQKEGVLLAMNEINAAGGMRGRQLRLTIEDTKSEPPTALTSFLSLAARPDIVAIFGSAASLDVPAYLPRVDHYAIPHLVPVAVLPEITEMGSKWTFRSALNDKVAAEKMAQFVVQKLKARHIGLLIEDSAFGETGLEFSAVATRLGDPPIAVERFRRGDVDLRPQLTKLAAAGVTHIQFWGYYSEYALAARQIRELGLHIQLMGNQAPVNEKTIQLGGRAVEGVLNICLFVPGDYSPAVRAFTEDYEKAYSSEPDTWAAQAYDAMRLLASVMEKVGFDRAKIREGLSQVRDYQGITGTISFQPNGDADFKQTHIVTVKDGRWVPFVDPR
jgi:branched-chain amino acid transport system substrate-binding protein